MISLIYRGVLFLMLKHSKFVATADSVFHTATSFGHSEYHPFIVKGSFGYYWPFIMQNGCLRQTDYVVLSCVDENIRNIKAQ